MQFKRISYYVLLFALLFVLACGEKKEEADETATTTPAPAAPAGGANAYDPSKATASVKGSVTFEGQQPQLARLQMSADPNCLKMHSTPVTEQTVELNSNGTLKNVLVYVKEGAEKWGFTPPSQPAVLDQKGCLYHPHVVTVMKNQPLDILNSDPTLHNVHPLPQKNPEFNQGMPTQGMKITKTFAEAEIIPVKCDVHRWMQSYIVVGEHPFYAVTGDEGIYTLDKLPAGTYTLEAWHEKYGSQTQQVTVADGEAKDINFTFKAS